MQPGDTITPKDPQTDTPAAVPPVETPTPIPTPSPAQAPVSQQATDSWNYQAEQVPEPYNEAPAQPQQPVAWTASEFIAHNKSASWFAALGIGLVVLLAAVFILTKDILATIMVGLAGIAFAVVSGRKPRVLQYQIDAAGIQIGDKHHAYQEFRSFTVNEDGPLPSLLLMSVKRFMPPITLFFDPNQADEIINALAAYLPHEDRPADPVDKLMGKIRF